MAYQTGTSTTLENLMTQLSTFLVANGWTEDFFTSGEPGRMGLSKNGIFVAFQWTELSDGGTLAIYHNLSNDDSASVWLSTGDSGNGNPSTSTTAFDSGRCINQAAGAHTAYHFFEQNASPAYCHVVLEVDAGRYRHFGFGELEKIGDWTGGEYCYGHFWGQANVNIDNPRAGGHTFMLDGFSQALGQVFQATMHVEDQPEQSASEVWMLVNNPTGFPGAGADRAGNNRLPGVGGTRAGLATGYMSQFRLSQLTAFKPLLPIPVTLFNSSPSPDTVRLMGTHPDVRIINMANLEPGETFGIAGETWFVFPWVKKQFLQNDTEESWNGGVAYRQELA